MLLMQYLDGNMISYLPLSRFATKLLVSRSKKNLKIFFAFLHTPLVFYCRHPKAQFQQVGICCQSWQCQHKCQQQWAWIQSGTYYVSQNAKTYSGLSASYFLQQFLKIRIGPVVLEKFKFLEWQPAASPFQRC